MNSEKLNKDYVRDLFSVIHDRERHIVERMSESQKYFTTLYSTLITATIALATWFYQSQNTNPPRLLAAIPLTAVLLLIIGFLDFHKHRRADLQAVATLAKIERYLGLHSTVEETKRCFPEDSYLIPPEYVEHDFKSSKDFIREWSSLRKQMKPWKTQTVFWPYVTLSVIAVFLAANILL